MHPPAYVHVQIRDHMEYLTSEQAMADYAGLIMELKEELDPQVRLAGWAQGWITWAGLASEAGVARHKGGLRG